MLDSHVLVLNRVFQAVQVTSVRKAFSLFYKGHVRAVLPDYSTYEFENWCDIPVQPQDEVVLSRGGRSTWENVVCACLSCNVKKGNRSPHEASMRLIGHPKKPRWHPVGHFGSNKVHPAWRNFLDVAYWNTELK